MTDEVDNLTEIISQLKIEEKTILDVLKELKKIPDLLKKKESKLQEVLQKQGNNESQGTGNKVTIHEACFAEVLESFGYKFLPKGSPNITESYYKYQPSGTQRNIDFEVFDKTLNKTIKFDLKHSNSKSFYLNDGWFEKDVIFIVNWSPNKKTNKILIAYGNEISTEEENVEMKKMIEFKKESNRSDKKCGSLRKYIRFANQYTCDRFTDEYSEERFNSVLKSLTQ